MILLRPSWSILHGLGDVISFNRITAIEVGDGERQLKDAVEGAGGKVKLFHGGLQQALGGILNVAKLPNFTRRHLGVAGQFGAFKAL